MQAQPPAREPQTDVTPEEPSFRKQALYLFRYAFVAAYFYLWSYKTQARHLKKVGALTIISASTLFLFLEVVIEWQGSETIQHLIARPPVPWLSNVLFVLFIIAVAYLLYHHYEESKKPGYEYRFVQKLTQFVQGGGKPTIDAVIPVALKLFYEAFERANILHCSIYQLDGSRLEISRNYVYPKISDPNYFIPLEKGEGVAGLVCQDKKSRYVPMVFFPFRKRWKWVPTFFFPHAVKFDFNRIGEDLELIHRGLDVFVFKGSGSTVSPFQSFVSVPLKSASQKECFGVLNFDFLRSDPLDRSDIAMAALFGLILGGEIDRLQNAALKKGWPNV